jgi:hypothetical protein
MGIVIQDIIIPEKGSECAEWIAYFKKLEERFGRSDAKTLWLKTWQVNGSTSCTTKPDFNKFLRSNDIDVSNLGTRAVAGIADLGGDLMGLGKGLTKILLYGVPVVVTSVIVVVLIVLLRASKNVKPSDIAMLTPAGRAAAVLK